MLALRVVTVRVPVVLSASLTSQIETGPVTRYIQSRPGVERPCDNAVCSVLVLNEGVKVLITRTPGLIYFSPIRTHRDMINVINEMILR